MSHPTDPASRIKVRRIDYYPDEFLVGVAGLTASDIGIYWVVCTLMYSAGGDIDERDERIRRIVKCRGANLQDSIDRLVALAKLSRDVHQLSSKRVRSVLQASAKRIQDAHDASEMSVKSRAERKRPLEPNLQPPTSNYQPAPSKMKNLNGNGVGKIDMGLSQNRIAAWQTGVINHINRTRPQAEAEAIITAYLNKEPEGIRLFNAIGAELKAIKQDGKERAH